VATIYDVARTAGVSPKTVSRVLNGDAPVNEKTLAVVKAAMLRLNYVPSRSARSLRSQKSGIIGLISGALSIPHNEPGGLPDILIVDGVQRVFAERGMTLMVADTGGKAEKVGDLIQTFLEHRVEGLLVVAEYHQKVSLSAASGGTPLVLVNCFDDAGTPAVVPDDEGGEYALTRGLIERGHRRIGFLTLPEKVVARSLRLAGYKRALREAGIPFDRALVITAILPGREHPFDRLPSALDELVGLKDPPTAICCGNDIGAMQLYPLLAERGLRVPDDISIAGYDDYRILTELMHPPLTSVALPYDAMGARAAEKLLRLVAGDAGTAETVRETVSGPVVWRPSVRAIQ
jgi:LacI family transcriptional regulator